MIGRATYVAAVLLALGISRLLPEHGFGLYLRLGAATLTVLLPGRLIAREHREPRPAYSPKVLYSAGRPTLRPSACVHRTMRIIPHDQDRDDGLLVGCFGKIVDGLAQLLGNRGAMRFWHGFATLMFNACRRAPVQSRK